MPLIMVSPYRKLLQNLMGFATLDNTRLAPGASLDASKLTVTTSNTNARGAISTMGKSAGKWYWEVEVKTAAVSNLMIGVGLSSAHDAVYPYGDKGKFFYTSNSGLYGGGTPYVAGDGGQVAAGDIIGIAFDADARTVSFYRNGVLKFSNVTSPSFVAGSVLYPIICDANDTVFGTVTVNFGATPFKYAVPSGYNAGVFTDPTQVFGRKFRFVALGSTQGAIGVHEFEIYDSTGRNVCRTTGLIPSVVGAPGGGDYNTYPPTKTIDGDVTNWASTTYLNSNPDGSMYLEYTFPVDINPVYWRVMPEGAWLPSPNPSGGVKLQMLRGTDWIDITGTPADNSSWATNTFKRFNVPTKV